LYERDTNDGDIVPYIESLIESWDGHVNAQYVTQRGINWVLINICYFVKTKKQINSMEDDEKNVFKETQLEYYCLRPKTVEFETMNIIDYFAKYEITVYYTTNLQKITKKTDPFIVKDINNNIIGKKSKPSIVRYHRLDVSEGEKYYFQQLILYYPFRQLFDLISHNNITKTYYEEWQIKNKNIIIKIIDFFRTFFRIFSCNLESLQPNFYDKKLNHIFYQK